MANRSERRKEELERFYTYKAITSLPGMRIAKIKSLQPPAPDVEVIFDDDKVIGVECRRYGEALSNSEEARQYSNAVAAQKLISVIEERVKQEFGSDENLKPCASFKVGPNSTDPFIPKRLWPAIASELVDAVKQDGFKPGPVFMGSPAMQSQTLVREHLQSFHFSDGVFSSTNFVTTRATFDEAAFLRIINEKADKEHIYDGKIWLLVHIGETGTSWPSTSLAIEAVHHDAAQALATSHFERMLVFDNFRVASLRKNGRYDVYPQSDFDPEVYRAATCAC